MIAYTLKEVINIKAYYIKQADKPNIIKRLLNFTEVKNDEIIFQPIRKKKSSKKTIKMAKKIKKICAKQDVTNVVLSKKLQENTELKNCIINDNIHILNGRWLFCFLGYEIAEHIIQKINKRKEETEISIVTNNITYQAIETTKIFAKYYKRVNVVTKNINKFKYLENKIYSQYGIMITVTNNKKKSLSKSNIILNFDFSEEELNQYNVSEKAVIVNIQGGIKFKKKSFKGAVFNDYEVSSPRADDHFEALKLKDFYVKDLLEAKLYRKDSFANIRKDVTYGYYKIKELY